MIVPELNAETLEAEGVGDDNGNGIRNVAHTKQSDCSAEMPTLSPPHI